MAECSYCKAETELHDNGAPICLVCAVAKDGTIQDSSGVQLTLLEEVRQATDRANTAAESFSSIIERIPSDVPHPDGVFRITQASRELSTARAEMMVAHRRLNDFISRGVIPEDLKAT